jgi:biotin synthase-like enzyme
MKKEEKITELLSKPELTEQLKACRDADKIRDLAKENDIEISKPVNVTACHDFLSNPPYPLLFSSRLRTE